MLHADRTAIFFEIRSTGERHATSHVGLTASHSPSESTPDAGNHSRHTTFEPEPAA